VGGILSGEILTAYALTESGSGSDALGARTTAVLDDERGVYPVFPIFAAPIIYLVTPSESARF
jgi:hypothetical protein